MTSSEFTRLYATLVIFCQQKKIFVSSFFHWHVKAVLTITLEILIPISDRWKLYRYRGFSSSIITPELDLKVNNENSNYFYTYSFFTIEFVTAFISTDVIRKIQQRAVHVGRNFGLIFFRSSALGRGSFISNIFQIGLAVPEIWSFLDLGLKMGSKLVWLKKISICLQNFMFFKDNYLASQNYLVDYFLVILDSYRVRHQIQTPEIRLNNKVQVLSNRYKKN